MAFVTWLSKRIIGIAYLTIIGGSIRNYIVSLRLKAEILSINGLSCSGGASRPAAIGRSYLQAARQALDVQRYSD